jgi:hypothetical protein
MKCEDRCARIHLRLGAEPSAVDAELEAHLRECAPCAQYRREMLQLDEQIRRAMQIDVAALQVGTAQPVQKSEPAYRRVRQWALAASVLLAVGTFLALWGALPRHSLAADVVSHVISEPIQQPLDAAVAESTIREVMQRSGLRLDPINPSIVFMRTCLMRGRWVPHFIVRTEHGMATVMVMPEERLKAPEPFEGNGYKGLLIPDGASGSIAVLSRADFDMERYAGEIRRAVHREAPISGD